MTSETVHLLKAVHPAQPMLFPCSKETNTLETNGELQTQSGWGWGNRMGACLLQAANPITVISHLTEKAKPELRGSLAYFSPVRLNSPHRLPLLSSQNHGAARDLPFQVCMVMGTRCSSLCTILCVFFWLLIVLMQSMGKVWARREELSLPAANTRATAHVTVCWLCCRGTWADG